MAQKAKPDIFPLFGILCDHYVPPLPRIVKVMDGDIVLGYTLVRDDNEFTRLMNSCRQYAKTEVEDAPPNA